MFKKIIELFKNYLKKPSQTDIIRKKIKELGNKYGLKCDNNDTILYLNNFNCCLNHYFLIFSNKDANKFIMCPKDFKVSKGACTNFLYDLYEDEYINFYAFDEKLENHIKFLLKRYKELTIEAKKKQIEFDFTENKKPIFDELCKIYNIDYFFHPTNYSVLGDSIIKQFSILYNYETNMIYFPKGFIENDTNLKNNSFKDVYFDTLEEYRDFIESHLEFFKKQLNEYIERI